MFSLSISYLLINSPQPIRGLYLAVTPNSLLGCFVLTPENIATLGKQQLSGVLI
ncbi:TPA: hypothetical protein ACKRT6_000928 [Providencia stuartii]